MPGRPIGCSAEQLAANQAGNLTAWQRTKMWFTEGWELALASVLLGLAALWAVGVLGRGAPTSYLIGSAIALLIALFLLWQGYELLMDLAGGSVTYVEGTMMSNLREDQQTYRENNQTRYRTVTHYYVNIGGSQFQISSWLYGQVPNGAPGRAYLTLRTQKLLSLEQLPS